MTLQKKLEITNKRGLHARASAKFVKCVEVFDADVLVSLEGQTVPGTSILGLMMLAAAMNTTIEVSATGPQAEEAISAIEALLADRFGEDRDDEPADTAQSD